MLFIPHTPNEFKAMLTEIGVGSIEDLFAEIPSALQDNSINATDTGMSEMAIAQLMQQRAAQDESGLCFIGAGAYEHYIPAAVWDIAQRGEFLTAYTPYQAEASQGVLQLFYEYQTMIANLTAMDVSNASLYDGASALAEAILMAVRANRQSKSARILMPATVNPAYRKVAKTIVSNQGIEIEELPFCTECGHIVPESLKRFEGQDITALVIPQPNFFGILEDVDALTHWAHTQGAFAIAQVNPISLAVLSAPGEWGNGMGAKGADITCGEGQPLGIPLSAGGPYFGFLCCRKQYVRQLPGRIIGRTRDAAGKIAYVLTLQAREQHIRRSKATSNICTNQGLLVIAATIYLSLLGAQGLRRVATQCHANAVLLQKTLLQLEGVEQVFNRPFFHEFVIRLNQPAGKLLQELAKVGIQGGYDLSQNYPELGDCLLVCATETKTETDLQAYQKMLAAILHKEEVVRC